MSSTPTPESLGAVAAERLSALVKIPTVSTRDPGAVDHAAFRRLAGALRAVYPRVHATLERTELAGHGLLYRWRGASETRPVVLLAHQDVAPVVAADWAEDPFSGAIRDGAVHGRGTLDDKGALVAVLDAVETLLAEGFTPAQDVWLSFGADDEVSGSSAQATVDGMREHGVSPWLVLDDGGAVTSDGLPGVGVPVALIGVAEKGVLDVELVTTDPGGHLAAPVRNGAAARLARALLRVDRSRFRASLNGPTAELLATLAPHTTGVAGTVLRALVRLRLVGGAGLVGGRPTARPGTDVRRWPALVLRPLLAWLLVHASPQTGALVRTTVAVTQLEGSPGATVVASSARARLTVRLALGDDGAAALARLRRVIRDPRVEVRVHSVDDASPVAPTDTQQWDLLRDAVGAAYPHAVPAPYVTLTASDSRRFHAVWPHVYRFSPFELTSEQRASVHGAGEHLTVDSLGRGVQFYRELLRSLPAG